MHTANMEPVFKTVGQALYTAFVMEITPPSTKGSTQLLIEDLMKQRYGEQTVPLSERSLNMQGMSPLELRGQCAMIRASVQTHLRGHERDTIHARFGHQFTRAAGVTSLRDQYASLCNTQNPSAVLALMWALYVPGIRQFPGESPRAFNIRRTKRENEWSVRGIEKAYGVNKDVLHRDQKMLRKLLHGVEMLAQNKMEELFVKNGVVVDPKYL